jgi:hypothetical protein
VGERSSGFLWIEGSPISVWALGEDRFMVTAPDHEQLVVGFGTRPSGRRTSWLTSSASVG